MRKSILLMFFVGLALELTIRLSQAEEKVFFFDKFEKSSSAWEPIRGDWEVKDGVYYQQDNTAGAYRYTIAETEITEGTIEVTATALEATKYAKGGCFGIMFKYLDIDNWCAMRYGDYQQVIQIGKGEGYVGGKVSDFIPVLHQKYKLRVDLRKDKVVVFLDDICLGIMEMPFVGKKARVGLWAGSKACFDDFKVYETPKKGLAKIERK